MLQKQFGKIMFGMLFAFIFSVISPVQAQDNSVLVGTWKGFIDGTAVGGAKVDFTITFSADDKGVVTGAIDGQGQVGMEIGDIKVEKKDVSFTLIIVSATFVGKLDEKNKKIAGDYTQAPNTVPFEMEKEEKKDK